MPNLQLEKMEYHILLIVKDSSQHSDATATEPPQVTRQKYEEAKLELQALLSRKKQVDTNLVNLEHSIYLFEGSYLEDTQQNGNIIRGFDGYLSSRPDRRKQKFTELDRLFSLSSSTYQKALAQKEDQESSQDDRSLSSSSLSNRKDKKPLKHTNTYIHASFNCTKSPELVRKVLRSFQSSGGYDAHVLPELRIVDSKEGRVHAEFKVEKQHLNRLKSVHGGLLATVVDIGGSLALASKGLFATGVSTDINISYISSAKEGDIVTVDATCDKLGKTLAFTSVQLSSGDRLGININTISSLCIYINEIIYILCIIVAIGRHSKFVAQAYSHPENELSK
ncbi:unnamed protein product [Cunninghamella blakesleeana]